MIPRNEMGVIVLFAQQCKGAGIEIVDVQQQFPDMRFKHDERMYRAEFEYTASNFKRHGHSIRGCDLIICWQNDLPNYILPIISLSDIGWQDIDLKGLTDEDKRKFLLSERATLDAREARSYASRLDRARDLQPRELERYYTPEARRRLSRPRKLERRGRKETKEQRRQALRLRKEDGDLQNENTQPGVYSFACAGGKTYSFCMMCARVEQAGGRKILVGKPSKNKCGVCNRGP